MSATEPDAEAIARRDALPPDRYWNPRRVARGLRALPADYDLPGGGGDPGMPRARRAEPWQAFEDGCCQRADLHRALLQLPWFERVVTWHVYIRDRSYTQTVRALASVGEVTTARTVEAIALHVPAKLAEILGWRPMPGGTDHAPTPRAADASRGRIRTWFASALDQSS